MNLGLGLHLRSSGIWSPNGGIPAPQNLVTSGITSSAITLSWDAVTGADHYEVYLDDVLVDDAVATESYEFTGLSAGTTYNLGVKAVDAENNKSALASVDATTGIDPITNNWDGLTTEYDYLYTTGFNTNFTVNSAVTINGLKTKISPKKESSASTAWQTKFQMYIYDSSNNLIATSSASSPTVNAITGYLSPSTWYDITWFYNQGVNLSAGDYYIKFDDLGNLSGYVYRIYYTKKDAHKIVTGKLTPWL